jgi:hypothetical protein
MSKKIVIQNEKIWAFYNANKNIDIEAMNIFFIDFYEKIVNHATKETDNISVQILQFMKSQNDSMVAMNASIETMAKQGDEAANSVLIQIANLKRDYTEDMRQIVASGSLHTNEKIGTLIDKSNANLIDKTTLLLNEALPKNNTQIQEMMAQIKKQMMEETQKMCHTSNGTGAIHDFVDAFDVKYATMMQPMFAFVSASENRITTNIDVLKDTSASSLSSQTKLHEEMTEFLGKYKSSTHKGKCGEQQLFSVLNPLFPTAEIEDTHSTKAAGDFIMRRADRPTILFENKEYNYNIPRDEVQKFIRDAETQNMSGIFISQHSGITFKSNFQIDIHRGHVLIYIQQCEYSQDKIKLAVDIIDNLAVKIEEFNTGDNDNSITKEVLDGINDDYQNFIAQREAMIITLKDFGKRMGAQIEQLQLPTLDKHLSQKYSSTRTKGMICDLCGEFSAKNKQSLAAHKRGCKKEPTVEAQNPPLLPNDNVS